MPSYTPSPNVTFGDTRASGSSHQFTGSIEVLGSVTASDAMSASFFYGDAAGLTNVPGGGGGGISWDGSTANGVATYKDADEATVESNLTFDGTTLTVAGDVTASQNISASAFYGDASELSNVPAGSPASPANSIQFNEASSFGGDAQLTWNTTTQLLAITGTLSMSGSSLEVFNGDIKVSSSAQYTGEGGSDTFYTLMKFYDTSEGQEKFISGAVWNITQERVELRNFGQDTGYKAFAADAIYTDAQFGFLGGNMTISDGNISAGSLSITGEPLTLQTGESTNLTLKTGYKSGETTGIMQVTDQDDAVWSVHSVSGTLINGDLTATGSAILGNASTVNHQVSGTLYVSGAIMQNSYFSASISTNVDVTCSVYNVFNYNLGGDVTLTPVGMVPGQSYLFFFRQDGTGGREVTFANFKWPGGSAPTFSDAAGAVDIVSGISDGTSIYADITKAFS